MKDYLKKVNEVLKREPDPAFARRARIIFDNLDLKGNEKLLEIGCGRGFYLKTLKTVWPELKITGVDINQSYLEQAKDFIGNLEEKLKDNLKESLKIELKIADATDLPFKDKTFDRIIATEILEHIPDDQKAISEMYRVLKPGGIVMVTVPNKNYPFLWDPLNWILERVFNWHIPANIWWLAGLWAGHVRLYGEKELRDKMSTFAKASADKEKRGFKVEKIWRATHDCFPFSHFLLYGVGKNIVEKGLLKPLNRFSGNGKQSLIGKIFLWPVKKVDSFNRDDSGNIASVNLIIRAFKPEFK